MEKTPSENEIDKERVGLTEALTELSSWYEVRLRSLRELHAYVQAGLQSGHVTAKRKDLSHKEYLTPRMITTLEIDRNQVTRTLMFMNRRRRTLESRLAELNSMQPRNADTPLTEDPASQESETPPDGERAG